jgi:hypothetical protein
LAISSKENLGKRYDVKKVWEEWMKNGSENSLNMLLVGGGVGHSMAEEASEEVGKPCLTFTISLLDHLA